MTKERSKEIYEWALAHRTAAIELNIAKDAEFPAGAPVYVDAPRYRGHGVVSRNCEHPDTVAVRLENGNTWWYPIECVRVVPWAEVDKATRRMHLRSRGINSFC